MCSYTKRPAAKAKKKAADKAYQDRDAYRDKRRDDWAARRDEQNARQRQRYRDNKAKILAQLKESFDRRFAQDPDGMRAKRSAYMARRRRDEAWVRISDRMSCRIRQSLKGTKASRSWQDIVGYSREQLEARLRQTIPQGYSWDDFLSARLEIDHIRPIASFRFTSVNDPEFRECWALSNLQLLTALDNNRKNSSWQSAATSIRFAPAVAARSP